MIKEPFVVDVHQQLTSDRRRNSTMEQSLQELSYSGGGFPAAAGSVAQSSSFILQQRLLDKLPEATMCSSPYIPATSLLKRRLTFQEANDLVQGHSQLVQVAAMHDGYQHSDLTPYPLYSHPTEASNGKLRNHYNHDAVPMYPPPTIQENEKWDPVYHSHQSVCDTNNGHPCSFAAQTLPAKHTGSNYQRQPCHYSSAGRVQPSRFAQSFTDDVIEPNTRINIRSRKPSTIRRRAVTPLRVPATATNKREYAEAQNQTPLDGDIMKEEVGTTAITSKKGNSIGYQFVPGKYHDHVTYPVTFGERKKRGGCGGITVLFPQRLHFMIECAEKYDYADIVSWLPHGRAFKIHNRRRFTVEVIPRFFKQSTFGSFSRQLRMYGFERLNQKQMDRGAYFHEAFLRGMPPLCANIQKLEKGLKNEAALLVEPDFYSMHPAPDSSINYNIGG